MEDIKNKRKHITDVIARTIENLGVEEGINHLFIMGLINENVEIKNSIMTIKVPSEYNADLYDDMNARLQSCLESEDYESAALIQKWLEKYSLGVEKQS